MTMKVGQTMVYDKKIKNPPHMRPAAYRDIKRDKYGWVNIKDGLPEDFDLVHMKVLGDKIIPGWLAGNAWKGLRLKKTDRVIAWNRKRGEMDESPT